jgi:2-(1,2-epoxy-1,2-dihydrophenyl)acetyl-CoA isomerase
LDGGEAAAHNGVVKGWVLAEASGPVGQVRLNRPERYNAFTLDMLVRLAEALERFSADARVRSVLIEAEGKAFCAGADLTAVAQMPTALGRVVQEYHRSLLLILTMPKPVITSVNGPAAGGGFSLAISGDYRLASAEARFTLAYMRAGLSIDGGSSRRLKQLVGLTQAQRLVFTNPTLSAAEAKAMGLVHEVHPPESLEREAMTRAVELASGPTRAYAAIKELLAMETDLAGALKAEEERIVAAAGTIDAREGIDAFLEKRPPQFSGG